MKKLTLFILLSIFCINIVFAYPSLSFNPSSINANIFKGDTRSYPVVITNTGNQVLSNLTFTNIPNVTITNIPSTLSPNQSVAITITANDNINSITTARFYYFTNATSNPRIMNISITPISFNPVYLEIRKGDTVQWRNNDNITHSVTENNMTFDQDVLSNQTWLRTFNAEGTTNYFTKTGGFSGQIVTNTNIIPQYVHQSSLDTSFLIHVSTSTRPANVSMEVFTNTFNLNYNEAGQGVLKISNGNSQALSLHLAMNWGYNFTPNNFNIDSNGYKIVTFFVIPNVKNTNQTNKSYSMNINLTGSNIQPSTNQVSVFVKYHRFNDTIKSGNNTPIQVVPITGAVIKSFCLQYPSESICNQTRTINQTIYKPMPVSVNVTGNTVENALKSVTDMTDSITRIKNSNQEALTTNGNILNEIRNDFGWTQRYSNQTSKDINEINGRIGFIEGYTLFKDILTFLVVLGIGTALFLRYHWEKGTWKGFRKRRKGW